MATGRFGVEARTPGRGADPSRFLFIPERTAVRNGSGAPIAPDPADWARWGGPGADSWGQPEAVAPRPGQILRCWAMMFRWMSFVPE
jgi:hypothetical protein